MRKWVILISVLMCAVGFPQAEIKSGNHTLAKNKKVDIFPNVYYLSVHSLISDAEIGMNSVTIWDR